MKVIDLLNNIANEEEVPKYINYTHKAFGKDTMMVCKENIINKLDIGAIELNDEVEIIEEDKKIEKLEFYNDNRLFNPTTEHFNQMTGWGGVLANKINEIIDYLEESK